MNALVLHEFHREAGARFLDLNGMEGVRDYGDAAAEYQALRESAGILDLSFRGRLCVLGAERADFSQRAGDAECEGLEDRGRLLRGAPQRPGEDGERSEPLLPGRGMAAGF